MLALILALLAGSGWMGWYVERQRRIHAERLSGTYFGAVVPRPRDPEPPAEERALAAAKVEAEDETATRLMQGLGISRREADRMIRVAEGNAE